MANRTTKKYTINRCWMDFIKPKHQDYRTGFFLSRLSVEQEKNVIEICQQLIEQNEN